MTWWAKELLALLRGSLPIYVDTASKVLHTLEQFEKECAK